MWQVFKGSDIKRESNELKPILTDDNKLSRLRLALSHIYPRTLRFQDMYDIFHLDEKCFYMTKEIGTFYPGTDEPPPVRSAKSNKFLSKVIFL